MHLPQIWCILIVEQQSKAEIAEEHRGNLPLPEQSPVAFDWNNADATTVIVSSVRRQDDVSASNASETGLREPVAVGSEAISSNIGRERAEKS